MPKSNPNLKKFLEKIAMLESSGGIQTDHPVIDKEGIQYGQKAIGKYGLLPNTIQEIINRRKMEGTMTEDMKELQGEEDQDLVNLYVDADPKLQEDLATTLGKHVLSRQLGDEERAAYSWNTGHNLYPQQISKEQLETNPYVEKFRKLKSMFKRKK
jgi:hypothetical protein